MKEQLLEQRRHIQELDVIRTKTGSLVVCTRVNDCSAKLMPCPPDWQNAIIDDQLEGNRVTPTIYVNDPDSRLMLVGRLRESQVKRCNMNMQVRPRIIGYVEVPMPMSSSGRRSKKSQKPDDDSPLNPETPVDHIEPQVLEGLETDSGITEQILAVDLSSLQLF